MSRGLGDVYKRQPQAAPAEDTTPEKIPLTDPARMTANEDENPM